MVPVYLLAKAAWSLANDAMVVWAQRLPVQIRSPEECAALARAAAPHGSGWPTPYKSDPLSGIGDHYTNPNRIEWALRQPDPRAAAASLLFCDCDDWAAWVFVATRHHKDQALVRLVTLVDAGLTKSHVIAVGKRHDGSWWAFDTNGLRDLPDGYPKTLCEIWGKMYETTYIAAHDSPLFW